MKALLCILWCRYTHISVWYISRHKLLGQGVFNLVRWCPKGFLPVIILTLPLVQCQSSGFPYSPRLSFISLVNFAILVIFHCDINFKYYIVIK
jgi:hypothetical protein